MVVLVRLGNTQCTKSLEYKDTPCDCCDANTGGFKFTVCLVVFAPNGRGKPTRLRTKYANTEQRAGQMQAAAPCKPSQLFLDVRRLRRVPRFTTFSCLVGGIGVEWWARADARIPEAQVRGGVPGSSRTYQRHAPSPDPTPSNRGELKR